MIDYSEVLHLSYWKNNNNNLEPPKSQNSEFHRQNRPYLPKNLSSFTTPSFLKLPEFTHTNILSFSLLWLTALSNFNKDWDVHWMPAKRGTDKRMWVRFPELREDVSNPSFQSESRDKLQRWAKTKGLPTPHHVELIVKMGTILVPGFPSRLKVARCRQIEILNAFEMVIMGVPDYYEGLDQLLKEWLIQKFLVDGESTLAGYRTSPDEPEAFIFHMTTWEATKTVLSSSARRLFEADFAKYPTMIYPRTVHEFNTIGVWKLSGNIRSDFAKGAESMNDTMKALTRHIDQMEECNQKQYEATHLRSATLTSTLQNVTHGLPTQRFSC